MFCALYAVFCCISSSHTRGLSAADVAAAMAHLAGTRRVQQMASTMPKAVLSGADTTRARTAP